MNEIPENGARPEDAESAAEDEARAHAESHALRLLEAVLFSSAEPATEEALTARLPEGVDVRALLDTLTSHYADHGVNLVRVGGGWLFRTAEDLAEELRVHERVTRRLSRAAMETLAIIAYHQPVTRAEIEEIRGVGLSRGTLDLLLESGWVAPKGRRRTAGRPVTWGTTNDFLTQFGLDSIGDLPGLDELKAAGLLDKRPAMQMGAPPAGEDGEEDGDGDRQAADGEAEGEGGPAPETGSR